LNIIEVKLENLNYQTTRRQKLINSMDNNEKVLEKEKLQKEKDKLEKDILEKEKKMLEEVIEKVRIFQDGMYDIIEYSRKINNSIREYERALNYEDEGERRRLISKYKGEIFEYKKQLIEHIETNEKTKTNEENKKWKERLKNRLEELVEKIDICITKNEKKERELIEENRKLIPNSSDSSIPQTRGFLNVLRSIVTPTRKIEKNKTNNTTKRRGFLNVLRSFVGPKSISISESNINKPIVVKIKTNGDRCAYTSFNCIQGKSSSDDSINFALNGSKYSCQPVHSQAGGNRTKNRDGRRRR